MSTVPKLDASGNNWAIFVFRFQDAVEAKGYWGHFDGSATRPTAADPTKPTSDETAKIAQWDKDERSAKSLLTQKLPDSTVVLIHAKVTVKARWDAVVKEFSKKSAYAQTDLRAKFMAMRCPEKTNPRDFLESLRVKKEELSQAGVIIEEKDFYSVILSSLPFALSNFASNLLAAAQFSSRMTMPNDLLSMLVEESDRQRAQRLRGKGSGKGKEEENEALAAGQTSKSKGKGKNKHADLTCYNCNKVGHISHFCKKPKKPKSKDDSGKDKKDDRKGSGSGTANVVESSKGAEEDGAWAAVEDADWFEEAVMETENLGRTVIKEFRDTSEEAFVIEDEAFVIETAGTDKIVELYDSGCMNHISPYRDKFEDFETIPPQLFRAANKQTFSTIGRGDMVIDIPNGDDSSQLRLKNVLYSPNVEYTLVSIGRLDEDGFTALFGHGKCVLRGPDDEKVGEVNRTSGKVYKVEHELGIANVAVDLLTLRQLHRWLGHPSNQVAHELVKIKMVTGIRLEYTPYKTPFFCDSCVHAKATRLSVPKIREGDRATEFGAETHSDLWGPAPVESRGGKLYWDTFIDDKTHLTNIYFL